MIALATKIWYCSSSECVHNDSFRCRRSAVRVSATHPLCTGFEPAGLPTQGSEEITGAVDTCDMAACVFNEDKQCTARAIHMIGNTRQPRCGTYRSHL